MSDISQNIERVREQIGDAARAAGRSADDVALMLAAKYQPVSALLDAIAAKSCLFGHNLIPQLINAEEGLSAAGNPPHTTTVIGHVQSNKLTAAMHYASRIDTLDSLKLAKAINRRVLTNAEESSLGTHIDPYPVLIQVNSSGAPTQFGVDPANLLPLAEEIAKLPGIRVDGLMTIGAQGTPSEVARSFELTRIALDSLIEHGLVAGRELSMGMSGDLDIAIAQGATVVRIGTAIFGPRPVPVYR